MECGLIKKERLGHKENEEEVQDKSSDKAKNEKGNNALSLL